MNPNYTIIVNSTDRFEDCWRPFFTLLRAYWPSCRQRIILNTEEKEFSFPGCDIVCSQVGLLRKGVPPVFGQSLHACLDRVSTPLVLVLFDDYFLNGPVNAGLIDEFAALMLREHISAIRLREGARGGPWRRSADERLWRVCQWARYRMSTQASLWRVDALRRYLKKGWNAWQFEVFGSLRACFIRDTILAANRDLFDVPGRQIIPYEVTGIIQGRWYRPAVVDLFARHGIEVDFSRRGFYDPARPITNRSRVLARLFERHP